MKKNKIIYLNGLIDLAQSRLGSKVVYKTDEFFAPASRIINPWPPVFKEGVFDKNGKWMDGWETRRKRTTGHDYLILKFGKPGVISKIDVDTSYFNGNQPSKVSIDACNTNKNIPSKNDKWINILGKNTTKPNSHHIFKISKKLVFTHIIRYECSSIIFLQAINIFIQAIMLETVIAFLGYGVRKIKYETIGKLISEFKDYLPGTAMGVPLAILPIVMLLLIAFVGNSWSKELLDEQYE